MKRHIDLERAIDLERRQYEDLKLDQSIPVEMMKQAPEDPMASTIQAYGSTPTKSGNPMEQFCIPAAPNDPDPRRAREFLENAGLKPGCPEYAAIRARAAELAANYRVIPSPDATSADEDETASDLELDTDANPTSAKTEIEIDAEEPDFRLDLRSFRSRPRQGPQLGEYRVRVSIRKRMRSSSSEKKVVKRRAGSRTSVEVNVEPRTASEERLACSCVEVFDQESGCSVHGVGVWTSSVSDA